MSKLTALGVALTLSWTLVGCAPAATQAGGAGDATNSPSPTSESVSNEPLALVETAFWPSDDLDYWTYLVLIENPNSSIGWLDESFVVEAFDVDGVLLDSDSHYSTVLPKATLALTGKFFSIGGSSAIAELDVRASEKGVDTGPLGEIGSVVLSEVSFENDRWSSVVSGIATSTFEDDRTYVSVVIVIRDNNGEVIAADYTVIERLPGGGKTRFEETFFDLEIKSNMTIETYLDL
jgi:hypothetical protein